MQANPKQAKPKDVLLWARMKSFPPNGIRSLG
jgi:hypothetical protein